MIVCICKAASMKVNRLLLERKQAKATMHDVKGKEMVDHDANDEYDEHEQ